MCSQTNLSTVNNGVSEGPSIEKAFLWFLQMFHLGAALLSHKCDAAKISTGLAIACCLMYISSHLISFLFSFLSPPKMTSRARSRPPMRGNAIFPTHTDLSIIRGEKITRQKITGQRLKSGFSPGFRVFRFGYPSLVRIWTIFCNFHRETKTKQKFWKTQFLPLQQHWFKRALCKHFLDWPFAFYEDHYF